MDIVGQSAIVTGGASGLGAATAERLARAGALVTIFDLNGDLAQSKAADIGCRYAALNVFDEAQVEAALDAAQSAHGVGRVLVNCAGIGPPAKAITKDGRALPLSDFAKIVNVNLLGTFNVLSKFAARAASVDPIGEERGVIINTASVAAFEGQVGQAAYAASKGAIVSMALPLAREFARYGIRVMTIAPGIFWTPLLATLPAEVQDSLGRQAPFPPRLGQPDEFARLVEAIITNPMLNAEVIRIDAAIRMAPK